MNETMAYSMKDQKEVVWFSQQSKHAQSSFLSVLQRQQFGHLSSSAFTHQHLISRWQSSRYWMEKMSLYDKLEGHDGCVNSVLFSDKGRWIFTGSDDTAVHIYDALSLTRKHTIETLHTNNIFYAKELSTSFVDENGEESFGNEEEVGWIVTCAADGRVFCHHVPTGQNQLIYRHVGRAHRIAMMKQSIGQFVTCGEDGKCCLFDLRDAMKTNFKHPEDSIEAATARSRMLQHPVLTMNLKNTSLRSNVSIYSVGINPMRSWEVALSGEHPAVCLFDTRFPTEPFAYLCPEHYVSSKSAHVTGLKYTFNGQMMIASYNDDDIYSYQLQEHMRESLTPSTNKNDLYPSSQLSASGLTEAVSEEEEDIDERKDEDDVGDGDNGPEDSTSPSARQMSHHRQLAHHHGQGYYQRYSGHKNTDTVKQVGLFGSKSEFVVSGSDCGHIFIWDIQSAELVKVLKGDDIGAVNCLAAHPTMPMLATSGLENNAKIWYPFGEHEPLKEGTDQYEKVQKILRKNRSGGSSSFRQRMLNPRSVRRILYLLTGSSDLNDLFMSDEVSSDDDMEEEDDNSNEESDEDGLDDENEEADESEDGDADGPAGSRRVREDSEATDRPTQRQRGNANVNEIAAMLPILRAALRRSRFHEEDAVEEDGLIESDEEDEDDEEDDEEDDGSDEDEDDDDDDDDVGGEYYNEDENLSEVDNDDEDEDEEEEEEDNDEEDGSIEIEFNDEIAEDENKDNIDDDYDDKNPLSDAHESPNIIEMDATVDD